mgnify:FL=1
MKRALAIFLSFVCSFMLISFGLSNWILNTPAVAKADPSFASVGGKIDNYTFDGKNESSTPYASFTTLEGAVKNANEKAATTKVHMYLTIGSHINVRNQTIKLNSGVSLYMPYSKKKCDISDNSEIKALRDEFIDISDQNIKKYRVSSFSLYSTNITISSGAAIYIGGQFRQKGVSGYYSEIGLNNTSSITVSGELYCNGYIKEISAKNVDNDDDVSNYRFSNESDKLRYVKVLSGGYLKTPMAFYDAGSMGELTGLNGKDVFPINVFDFPCIQTYFSIASGAKFEAAARMFKSSGGTEIPINETLLIIYNGKSNKKNPFIKLTSGYISFEYCPLQPGYTSSDASKTYMCINGAADLGYISITVNGTDITTSGKFLPMSYKMQVVIGKAGNFNTNGYDMKFMGGSSLTVCEGGTLNLKSKLIGYKAKSTAGIIDYPQAYGDSKFLVNGSVVMSSSAQLGGHFTTKEGAGNAKMDLSNAPQDSLKVTSYEGLTKTGISVYATGDFFDSDTDAKISYLLKGGVVVSSDPNERMCWTDGGNLNSFLLTIRVDNRNNYEHPVLGYKVSMFNSSNKESSLTPEGVYVTTDSEFPIEKGLKFKVDSLDRAEKTEFTSQNGSNYTFSSGTSFTMVGDIEVTIYPSEGVLVRFSIDNESGSGGSTTVISESATSGGTYYQIGTSSAGSAVDIAVKKGAYIKYEVTQGNAKGTKLGNHYLFSGLVTIHANDDSSKNNGQQLTTKIKNKTSFFGYILAGSTSVSTNTHITSNSTIHAYIEKR